MTAGMCTNIQAALLEYP